MSAILIYKVNRNKVNEEVESDWTAVECENDYIKPDRGHLRALMNDIPDDILCKILSCIDFEKAKIRLLSVSRSWRDALRTAASHRADSDMIISESFRFRATEDAMDAVLPVSIHDLEYRLKIGGMEHVKMLREFGAYLANVPAIPNLTALGIDILAERDVPMKIPAHISTKLNLIYIRISQLYSGSGIEEFLKHGLRDVTSLETIYVHWELEKELSEIPEIGTSGHECDIRIDCMLSRGIVPELKGSLLTGLVRLDLCVETGRCVNGDFTLSGFSATRRLRHLEIFFQDRPLKLFSEVPDIPYEKILVRHFSGLPKGISVMLSPISRVVACLDSGWQSHMNGEARSWYPFMSYIAITCTRERQE